MQTDGVHQHWGPHLPKGSALALVFGKTLFSVLQGFWNNHTNYKLPNPIPKGRDSVPLRQNSHRIWRRPWASVLAPSFCISLLSFSPVVVILDPVQIALLEHLLLRHCLCETTWTGLEVVQMVTATPHDVSYFWIILSLFWTQDDSSASTMTKERNTLHFTLHTKFSDNSRQSRKSSIQSPQLP